MNRSRVSRAAPRNAFTLIELLIVVGIIAILAMIALPNFLEAQVRAKMSRAKADMSTVRLALESYCVDNNHYAFDNLPGGEAASMVALTTPMAYLTSIPVSPFRETEKTSINGRPTYEYWNGHVSADGMYLPDEGTYQTGIFYRLSSVGPDGIRDFTDAEGCYPLDIANKTPAHMNALYDPTNGTVSPGDVLMTSKGFH